MTDRLRISARQSFRDYSELAEAPGTRYRSIKNYYEALPKRARDLSAELDFGVWWWIGGPPSGSSYRVSWVENTGELLAVCQMPGARGSRDSVEILAVIDTESELEHRLQGWAEACGGKDSLEWVRERV